MRYFIFLITLIASQKPIAHVNTMNGSFNDHWFDFPITKKLLFHRTYNSRTLHDGWFGLGWCSVLETKITRSSNEVAKIHSCQSADTDLFRLDNNPKLFQGNGWSMALLKDKYVARNSGGDLLRFDHQGRLTQVDAKNYPTLFLQHFSNKIQIFTRSSPKFELKFSNGKLHTVSIQNRNLARYFYTDGLLSIVSNAWKNTYSYRYDDSMNLVSIRFPDQSFKYISYDKEHDRVRTVLHRDYCYESYKYQETPPPLVNGYKVRARKKCPQGDERIVDLNYVYVNRALAYFEKSENGEIISRRYFRQSL